MADERLYDIGRAVLTQIENYYGTEGIDLPERRYVHFGEVAIDGGLVHRCEQLVVTYLPGAFLGFPGEPEPGSLLCEVLTTATFQVWLSRCVPTFKNDRGDPPDPGTLDGSGRELLVDALAINRALYLGRKTMFAGIEPRGCRLIALPDQSTQGPQGGYSSVVQPIEVGLN